VPGLPQHNLQFIAAVFAGAILRNGERPVAAHVRARLDWATIAMQARYRGFA
jgi:hypothetical protein